MQIENERLIDSQSPGTRNEKIEVARRELNRVLKGKHFDGKHAK